MDSEFAARTGFTDLSWRRVMRVAREAGKKLDLERVDLILQLLRETYVVDADNQLLLTGRASLSRTFVAKLKAAMDSEFPDVKLLHKVEER
jgi:hemolysin activation/secretion protein